jgi:TolB-like protein
MKKLVWLSLLLVCAGFVLYSCVSDGGSGSEASSEPPRPVYFTGDGGKGMSLAVLVPEGKGLASDQNYLPTMVQGVFVGDFSKYSDISVLDRQNLDKVIEENYSGYYEEEYPDLNKLGHLIPTDYIMTGAITKTGAGYALQMQIADNKTGITKASYTGNCSIVEFDSFTGIRKASAELLAQMGVSLTDKAKQELSAANTGEQVSAETALAKGITAQQKGTVVEALSYYYEAAKFDPSLAEAASRGSALSTDIQSGANIGQNVRNDIQHRAAWLKPLNEASAFFKEHPPFEIVYDTTLTQGEINYNRGTVDISFDVYLIGTTGLKIISDLQAGLEKTGKSKDWGLSGWPVSGEAAVFFTDILSYTVNVALANEDGKTLGTARGELKGSWRVQRKGVVRSSESSYYPFSHDKTTLTFRGVNANDITDSLRVSITNINGMDAKTAGAKGYIGISAEDFSTLFRLFDFRWETGGVRIIRYEGSDENVVIPAKIGSWAVVAIGDNRWAFASNLTSVTIPNSVTSIGGRAFRNEQLTSVTIPANVSLEDKAFYGEFNSVYERNGKKAGTYTLSFWSEKWTYRGR